MLLQDRRLRNRSREISVGLRAYKYNSFVKSNVVQDLFMMTPLILSKKYVYTKLESVAKKMKSE